MEYTGNSSAYPDHNIDPEKKGHSFHLDYAKAMWNDSMNSFPNTIFYHNAENYRLIDQYMTGDIPIDRFKKLLNQDADANTSPLAIDWTPRRLFSKFRDIGISKILQRGSNIRATPIDAISKNEIDDYYAEMKAKIALRQAMEKQGAAELVDGPELAKGATNEPETPEELEMHMEYDYKPGLAMECELAIDVIFNDNNIHTDQREFAVKQAFDYGVVGYCDGHDNDGRVTASAVDVRRIITNYCRKKDFSDMIHWGEVIRVRIADLADMRNEKGEQIFSVEDIKEIEKVSQIQSIRDTSAGETNSIGPNKGHVYVLRYEFFTWNTQVFRRDINPEGNFIFKDSKYENKDKPETFIMDGVVHKKYITRTNQAICEGFWIIDSNFVYNHGFQKNTKRSLNPRSSTRTSLSLHLMAADLVNMKAYGIGERAIPLIDEYHQIIFKAQNLRNRMIPSGYDIDLDALEDVSLVKGGTPMHPKDVLKFFFSTGILLSRRRDVAGNQNANYKAVNVLQNSIANDLAALWNDIANVVNQMRDITGLNELTDGSTPNAKTLVPVANMAYESTNNSLYLYANAEKRARERLAAGCVMRLQSSLRRGIVYDGYAYSMGRESLRFIKISSDVGFREFAIKLEDQPTDEERQLLVAAFTEKKQQGLLTEEDVITIMETKNLKQAYRQMAYKIRKREEKLQAQKEREIQLNAEAQKESNIVAESEKRKTLKDEIAKKMALQKQIDNAKRRLQYEKFQQDAYIKWLEISGKDGKEIPAPPMPDPVLPEDGEVPEIGEEEMAEGGSEAEYSEEEPMM
jgi:hypothetical protein